MDLDSGCTSRSEKCEVRTGGANPIGSRLETSNLKVVLYLDQEIILTIRMAYHEPMVMNK